MSGRSRNHKQEEAARIHLFETLRAAFRFPKLGGDLSGCNPERNTPMTVYTRGTCEKNHKHNGYCETWYYDFMIRRVRYREAIPEARTEAEAKCAETKARQEVYEGRYGKPRGSTPFKQFVQEQYLPWARTNNRSVATAETMARMLIAYFGEKPLADITSLIVERFKRDRLAEKTQRDKERKPGSVNCELAYLSKILSLAVESGELAINPCARVKRLRADNGRD
jgi:hypothetical protein